MRACRPRSSLSHHLPPRAYISMVNHATRTAVPRSSMVKFRETASTLPSSTTRNMINPPFVNQASFSIIHAQSTGAFSRSMLRGFPREYTTKSTQSSKAPAKANDAKSTSSKAATPTTILSVEAGASCIPHPEKAAKGGEDAFFISESSGFFGVADGVGGWAEVGVDPSLYSRKFMELSKEAAENLPDPSPQQVMQLAHDHPQMKAISGSATVCIAAIKGDAVHVANLGDSGAMLVRDGKPLEVTKEQQKRFNFPYQLGTNGEQPSLADIYTWTAKGGDVLVLGTDGLWDNLLAKDVAAEIRKCSTNNSKELAKRIADMASVAANSKTKDSPFSVRAKANRISFSGGKLDDITVVVCNLSAAGTENQKEKI